MKNNPKLLFAHLKCRSHETKNIISLFTSPFFYFFAQTKGHIDKETKEFYLRADIKKDHTFFGYSKPTKRSTKLICFSIFTKDVKDNPYKCLLGAYYESNNIPNGDKIIYSATIGKFIKMKYLALNGKETIFYFKKWRLTFD